MRHPHHIALSSAALGLALAAFTLLPGCIVAAATVGGAVAGQTILEDNTFVHHLNYPSNLVWAQTKSTLARKSTSPIDVDESRRRAVADVEGTTVTCTVETYDVNQCVLRVQGKKFGFPDNEVAKVVVDRIVSDLSKTR